jgi:hypothetical protein
MLINNRQFILISPLLLMLFSLLFLFIPTGQIYSAPDTLDLQLDDPAIIRWDISDILPGDSGIQPIDLHNAGDIRGYVYIWISDIADGEGLNPDAETGDTAEPGELSAHVLLNIINPGVDFGKLTGSGYIEPYELPVNIAAFPGSSNQALFLLDTAINPGGTLTLQWQWELPPSAGNEVQGDSVSFTFNYMLSSFYTEEEEDIEPNQPPVYIPPPTIVPPTTPVTTPPTTEPLDTPKPDEPEDDIEITAEPDESYVVLIAPDTTTPPIQKEEPSDNNEIWAQASLGIAVTGTCAMTSLAIIERIRHHRRMKSEN